MDTESVPGSASGTNGALFYFTEMRDCGGIDCPPYTNGVALTCAVCQVNDDNHIVFAIEISSFQKKTNITITV